MKNQTHVYCDSDMTDHQSRFLKKYSFLMEIMGNLPVCLIGLTLNIIAGVVLLSPKMRNNFFNRLLLVLAIYDSIYLTCGLIEVIGHRIPFYVQQYFFVHVGYPLRSIVMFCSIYTTVALSFERKNAITSPISHRNRNNAITMNRRLLYYIGPMLLFASCYYVPKFFDLHIEKSITCMQGSSATTNNSSSLNNTVSIENCTTKHIIRPTPLRVNHQYIFWYINVLNIIVTWVVPVTVLLYLNCRIYYSLRAFLGRSTSNSTSRRNDRNSNRSKTFILFSIVVLFVICHAVRLLLNIDEFISLDIVKKKREGKCDLITFWQRIAVPLNQLFILLNSSGNFFVYVFFDETFQQTLKNYICGNRTERREETNNLENGPVAATVSAINDADSQNHHATNNEIVELTEMIPTVASGVSITTT